MLYFWYENEAWLAAWMLTTLVVGVTCVRAQEGTPPPTAEPSPAPTATLETSLTPTSELQTIQPTPEPSAPNNLWRDLQQVWEDNREAILSALIMALLTGVIIGVFIKNAASKISEWLGRFFHFLFDRFASGPFSGGNMKRHIGQHWRKLFSIFRDRISFHLPGKSAGKPCR